VPNFSKREQVTWAASSFRLRARADDVMRPAGVASDGRLTAGRASGGRSTEPVVQVPLIKIAGELSHAPRLAVCGLSVTNRTAGSRSEPPVAGPSSRSVARWLPRRIAGGRRDSIRLWGKFGHYALAWQSRQSQVLRCGVAWLMTA
jgi:hypothetical protein